MSNTFHSPGSKYFGPQEFGKNKHILFFSCKVSLLPIQGVPNPCIVNCLFVTLLALLTLSSASNRPYGHYNSQLLKQLMTISVREREIQRERDRERYRERERDTEREREHKV